MSLDPQTNRKMDRSFLSVDITSPSCGFGSNFSRVASISRHALAHECNVLGIQESTGKEQKSTGFTDDESVFDQVKWETSFHPHQVQEVVSTYDGLIIAAATDDGSISLLNGMNGSLISTRKLIENHSEANDSFSLSTNNMPSLMNLQFISSSQKHGSKEALLIFDSTSLSTTYTCDSPTSQSNSAPQSNAIVVAGIDTNLLTSSNPTTLQYAARALSVEVLPFEAAAESNEKFEELENSFIRRNPMGALNGIFTGSDVIRFLACCTKGRLTSSEYNISSKMMEITQNNLLHNMCFDYESGIKVDTNCEVCDLFVVSSSSKSKKSVNWISVETLEISCQYTFQLSNNEQSSILALEPIHTCCAQSAVAVAVALQETSDQSNITIFIIQAVATRNNILEINDESSLSNPENNDEISISNPHIIYSIPVYQGYTLCIDSISIAPIRQQYSFKYVIANESSQECNEFLTSKTGPQVGKFRMLLAQGLFDEADDLISHAETLSDNFEKIHNSEVALWSLRDLLTHGNISSPENISIAKECLRRLALGAITGGDVGVRCLLSASKSLSIWPVSQENNSKELPLIEEFSMSLTVMSKTFEEAIKSASSNHVPVLESEKLTIDLQLRTIHILEEILCNDSNKNKLKINLPFSSACSPVELYNLLISLANFSGAERVRRLEWGKSINIYEVAQSVSLIPKTVNPLLYLNWLENFVISGLSSVNHHLINSIQAWACQTADKFDENGQGLHLSIIVLKAVVNGTAKLFSKTVANHSLVVEETRLKNTMNQSIYLDQSKNSLPNSIATQNQQAPNASVSEPTLLQFFKYSKPEMFSPSNSSFSAVNNFTYDENDCEIKLQNALELEKARSMGLSKDILSLRNYGIRDGAKFVARELIKIVFREVTDDSILDKDINGSVKEFCNFSGVNFDESIDAYTQVLCENEITQESISKLVLLARCSLEPTMKCNLALKALRTGLSTYNPPGSLFLLSRDALIWATDEITKSELEEASRLLTLDKLVRKYCGNEARELFQASNPQHATSLMNYICSFIDDPLVMIEVFDLCNSFFHLSKVQACVRILHNIIFAPEIDKKKSSSPGLYVPFSSPPKHIVPYASRLEQISLILTELFRTSNSLAIEVGSRLIMICSHMLKKCSTLSTSMRSIDPFINANAASSSAVCVLTILLENRSMRESDMVPFDYFSNLGVTSLTLLLEDFQRVLALQQEFKVYINLSELHEDNARIRIAEKMLTPAFNLLSTGDSYEIALLTDLLAKAKRGFCLLYAKEAEDKNTAWFEVTGQILCKSNLLSNDNICFTLLKCVGLLDAIKSEAASRVLVKISKALLLRSIETVQSTILSFTSDTELQPQSILRPMKCIVASFLLSQYAMMSCPRVALGSVINQGVALSSVVQIFSRADCGIGEMIDKFIHDVNLQNLKCRDPCLKSDILSKIRVSESKDCLMLHQNWYVGDGLLIPPLESIYYGIELFFMVADVSDGYIIQMSTFAKAREVFTEGIFSFLNIRGAHALALRLKYLSLANQVEVLYTNSSLFSHSSANDHYASIDTIQCLAERSLGESNGITCGIVDHSLAVAYLLLLIPSQAVKVFASALTGAMSRRDFSRAFTIANVGLCTGELLRGPIEFNIKCERLAMNAFWWKTFVFHNAIDFPIDQFCGSISIHDDEDILSSYSTQSLEKNNASFLISLLIECASKKLKNCESLFSIANKFGVAFSVKKSLVHRKLTEFFLLPSQQQCSSSEVSNISFNDLDDIRNNLTFSKKAAQRGLSLISSSDRLKVLRKCVLSLENSKSCGRDYERYSLVLNMYQVELMRTTKENQHKENFDSKVLFEELQNIGRRIDAIALLSSYFFIEQIHLRPNYQNLFLPLRQSGVDRGKNSTKYCGVIPPSSDSTNVFDPLAPLSSILINDEVASSLAPLCNSLCLPQGYVHVRALYNRFVIMQENNAVPSFELNVYPVLKRLQQACDSAAFAEWCADQYDETSEERLKCLEFAHTMAIKASNEAEHHKKHCSLEKEKEKKLARVERHALDTVKKIEISRSSLADLIDVEKLFRQKVQMSNALPFKKILESILKTIQNNLGKYMNPENFVKMLLTESSDIAAVACLDENIAFTIDHFLDVAYIVHEGCNIISEKHSHVHVGSFAKSAARQWLTFGDDRNVQEKKTDERSIFTTNSRERSDYSFSKSILRITFVISFASGYFNSETDDEDDKENAHDISTFSSNSKYEKSSILMAPHDNMKQKFRSAFGHAKELLIIAFATSEISMKRLHLHKTRNAITFAMRYRALRVAALLCPMEILMKVIKDEGFPLKKFSSQSLSQCLFGSFVAMEIESMGLTLPHSDIIQLTFMDFSSYARTLYKYHSLNGCKGFKARILYLLLELCLNDCSHSDVSLTVIILDEISKLKENPRTMLASCELIASAVGKIDFFNKFLTCQNGKGRQIILLIIEKITNIVSAECREKTPFLPGCVSIIRRLGRILSNLTDIVVKQQFVLSLVTELLETVEICFEDDDLSSEIHSIVIELSNLLRDDEIRLNILKSIKTDYTANILSEKSASKVIDYETQASSVLAAFNCLDVSVELK